MEKTKKKTKETKTAKYYQAVGRRKTATATVRLYKGSGKFLVNEKEPSQYFDRADEVMKDILGPLTICGLNNQFDITAKVKGGGKVAQAEAIRLGIARALVLIKPELKQTLKKVGFLTRDPREKERKKPGLKRARRAPQWQKR